jgi:preprotein translocase subunit YajC
MRAHSTGLLKLKEFFYMIRIYTILMLVSSAGLTFAQETGGAEVPQAPLSNMFMMMAILFGIFYFVLIRPQQKQRQKHEERVNSLKKGDRIIGAGGLYGEIVAIDGDKAVIAVGKEKVKLEILKSTITHTLTDEKK